MTLDGLRGRVAVITGGASGIGRALAERFATAGARLVLADVEEPALAAAGAELRAAGAEVAEVVTDVADPGAVDALADAAYERFGVVHVVCNNAGVVSTGPSWEQSIEDWQWVLGVDLWGVIHGVRSFVPRMLAGGEPGHIVNTASIAGLLPFPNIAPYDVAKAGVVALSEALHSELRAAGGAIGVSVLCPGVVPTRISESGRNRPGAARPEQLDIGTQRNPPPTALTPAQIAEQVHDAIVGERFWIVTHEPYREWITRRAEVILTGTEVVIPPVL